LINTSKKYTALNCYECIFDTVSKMTGTWSPAPLISEYVLPILVGVLKIFLGVTYGNGVSYVLEAEGPFVVVGSLAAHGLTT